jgi:hypothetical protein
LYLLDTSALRNLSKKILQAHTFYTSSFCVWELVCHLDEVPFDQSKGQLMKAKRTRILDDPRAPVETLLLPHDRELQRRVSDEELVTKMLHQLDKSESLQEFYKSDFRDSNGSFRQVSGLAARARNTLVAREQEYLRLVQQIINALKTGQTKIATDEEYHNAILSLLEGDIVKLQKRGATHKRLRDIVTKSYYIHWSYIVHRTVGYFKRGKTKLDGNDFEDAEICRHLWLDTPYCLVTADKEQKRAIEKTITLINRLNIPGFPTTLRVIDANALR